MESDSRHRPPATCGNLRTRVLRACPRPRSCRLDTNRRKVALRVIMRSRSPDGYGYDVYDYVMGRRENIGPSHGTWEYLYRVYEVNYEGPIRQGHP